MQDFNQFLKPLFSSKRSGCSFNELFNGDFTMNNDNDDPKNYYYECQLYQRSFLGDLNRYRFRMIADIFIDPDIKRIDDNTIKVRFMLPFLVRSSNLSNTDKQKRYAISFDVIFIKGSNIFPEFPSVVDTWVFSDDFKFGPRIQKYLSYIPNENKNQFLSRIKICSNEVKDNISRRWNNFHRAIINSELRIHMVNNGFDKKLLLADLDALPSFIKYSNIHDTNIQHLIDEYLINSNLKICETCNRPKKP